MPEEMSVEMGTGTLVGVSREGEGESHWQRCRWPHPGAFSAVAAAFPCLSFRLLIAATNATNSL